MVWPIVVAAAISTVGSLIAQQQASNDVAEQMRLAEEIRKQINSLPDAQTKAAVYEQLKSQGQLTPQTEEIFAIPDSEMKNIATDPAYKQAQMVALQKLADYGEGRESFVDQAAVQSGRNDILQQQSNNNARIESSLAQRGLAGSGMELAAKEASDQSLSNRLADYERNIQQEARQRALQAILQRGTLASQMQSNEFSQKAQQAQAQDAINRFNTANRQQVTGQNIDRGNNAEASNLQNTQRISDANVGIRNSMQDQANALAQQKFNNNLNRAVAAAGANKAVSDVYGQKAQDTRNMWSGIIGGVNQGIGNYYAYKKKDEDEE